MKTLFDFLQEERPGGRRSLVLVPPLVISHPISLTSQAPILTSSLAATSSSSASASVMTECPRVQELYHVAALTFSDVSTYSLYYQCEPVLTEQCSMCVFCVCVPCVCSVRCARVRAEQRDLR